MQYLFSVTIKTDQLMQAIILKCRVTRFLSDVFTDHERFYSKKGIRLLPTKQTFQRVQMSTWGNQSFERKNKRKCINPHNTEKRKTEVFKLKAKISFTNLTYIATGLAKF